VFTPIGDVIDLPTESTPVDFAYAIHSDLGDHMQGAKVNGKLVSFETILRNGDIIEILKSKSAHPTARWLEYARTSMARRHIRNTLDVRTRASSPRTSESKADKKKKKPLKKSK
jgi:GTP pyrophosphokinase